MKRNFARLFPILAIILFLSAVMNAQSAPSNKVGVINIQAAVFGSNEGQRDFTALQKKFEPRKADLDAAAKELDDLQKQLSTQGDKLNDEAKANLAKQIDSKKRTAQRSYEDAQNDFQAQQQEIFQRILGKMSTVLEKFVKDNGYSVVLDAGSQESQVIYAAESVNITPAVVEAYNAQSGVPAQAAPVGAKPAAGAAAPVTRPATKPAAPATTKPAPPPTKKP